MKILLTEYNLTLSMEEAEKLYNELKTIFDNKKYLTYPDLKPLYDYQKYLTYSDLKPLYETKPNSHFITGMTKIDV